MSSTSEALVKQSKYVAIATVFAGIFLLLAVVLNICYRHREPSHNVHKIVHPGILVISAVLWITSGVLALIDVKYFASSLFCDDRIRDCENY